MSKQADYGFMLLAHMAREAEARFHKLQAGAYESQDRTPGVHSARDLAANAGLPQPIAGKILKALARSGILESRRGAAGGYALARDPARISLAAVIEALEGPIGVTECSPHGLGLCRYESDCLVQSPLQRLSVLLRDSLARVSLRDLVAPDPLHAADENTTERETVGAP